MLPKKFRLNEERDILKVLRSGKILNTPFFTLRTSPSPLPYPRFGFVVSKKVSNKPHDRNLIKRRMRNIIMKHYKEIPGQKDFLFLARAQVMGKTFAELKQELEGTLKKLKAI